MRNAELQAVQLHVNCILHVLSVMLVCSTHFEVFVVSSFGPGYAMEVPRWGPGLVQLQWQDLACLQCQGSGGVCVYARNRSYYGCNCSHDGHFHENCYPSYSIRNLTLSCLIYGAIGIGGPLLFVALCCCGYRCGKRSMKNQRLKRRALWERQHSVNGANVDDSTASELLDLRGLAERPMEFSYKSIQSATNSFSSLVGKGGFGVVFKGALTASRNKGNNQEQYASTCKEIAVKVLDVRSHHSKKQFLNEVAIIGRVHHINVVRLLGFCVHEEDEMLVYEYVSNGSLDQWLFDKQNRDKMTLMLDWRQRYSIAVGIARGLSYLHEECRHRIVHCDIKPQNILLDGHMCPKIADFGLARLINRGESRVVTFAKGTPGYMAPELWVGGDIQLTTKADVYSFGMVLLEMISGRQNFALGLPHFPAMAFDTVINKGNVASLLDARLMTSADSEQNATIIQQHTPTQHEQQQIRTAVFVALWCIQESPASRPCMSAVVQFLEGVTAVSEQLPAAASAGSVQLAEGQHINSFALSSTDLTPR